MAPDERVVSRLRRALGSRRQLGETPMFGGICFMLRGHMLCGAGKPGFMFRVGKEHDAEALGRRGASPIVFNGRRFCGFVWVDPSQCTSRDLRSWIALAEGYIATLPAKPPRKKAARVRRS